MIFWSIAVAAGGLVASYTRLFIARAVLGISESPAYPTAVRVTSDWFQVSDRGVSTGVFNLGSNIGVAIGPPLLTALMLLAGWRWMFIIMGMVGIGAWMYVTWLPGYLEGEHHISIARTGYLASIPLLCSILGSFCGGYASDRLVARGMPIVQARKLPAALDNSGISARLLRVLFQHSELWLLSRRCLLAGSHGADR